jgi:gentisate 1,2-dioxygenase
MMSFINERWAEQAMTWEYAAAASPDLADIPIRAFPSQLHEEGETRIIGLDLSEIIGTPYSATTPNLMANYLRICQNDKIQTAVQASSEVFFVMRGRGRTETDRGILTWQQGDAFTLPTNSGMTHSADEDTALFWVHDAPMLQYIGAIPATPRFEPTYYSKSYLDREITRVREAGIRENRNRNGVILGNPVSEKTRTMTPTMWSLYNLLPKGATQQPHRHNSVAIDLAVYAESGTYTLIGKEIDAAGNIINPVKAEWKPNTVFVTPPGLWHSHHNHSSNDAYVFPVQDAGMQIYMRTLAIQFVK